MNAVRRIFSIACTALRIASFAATIALHGGDILNVVHAQMNASHFGLHLKVARS